MQNRKFDNALKEKTERQFLTTFCLSILMQTTKRTGWVNHGVKDSESIADHMYRMAVMAIISGDLPGVNKDRYVVCTTLLRTGLKENFLEFVVMLHTVCLDG